MAQETEQIEVVDTNDSEMDSGNSGKSSGSSLDLGGIELFYEKNKKAITYGGGAIVAIVALFSLYKFYWLPGQEKEAATESFFAQTYFEKDSFNIALNGGINVHTADGPKTMMGFKELAESYSSTKTGNLSNYYAGICLLRTGKFEEAIEFLEKFDGSDEVVAPMATGALGDANMELNRTDEAIKYYLKAADKSVNEFSTPYFLKKAGFAYEQKANYTEALATYERLKTEYGKSADARDIDKYIARVKVLGNIQ